MTLLMTMMSATLCISMRKTTLNAKQNLRKLYVCQIHVCKILLVTNAIWPISVFIIILACGTSWQKYTPNMLKGRMNKSLKYEKTKTKDTWAKVAEAKLEKYTLEMEFMREKHELEKQKLMLEIEILKSRNSKN